MIRRPDHPVTPWLVSKADAARLLGLSERMIDKLVERGELSRVRFGSTRGVRFKVSELEALIEGRTVTAEDDDRQARDRAGRFRKQG